MDEKILNLDIKDIDGGYLFLNDLSAHEIFVLYKVIKEKGSIKLLCNLYNIDKEKISSRIDKYNYQLSVDLKNKRKEKHKYENMYQNYLDEVGEYKNLRKKFEDDKEKLKQIKKPIKPVRDKKRYVTDLLREIYVSALKSLAFEEYKKGRYKQKIYDGGTYNVLFNGELVEAVNKKYNVKYVSSVSKSEHENIQDAHENIMKLIKIEKRNIELKRLEKYRAEREKMLSELKEELKIVKKINEDKISLFKEKFEDVVSE